MTAFSLDDAQAVCKNRDAWWTVFLADPLAVRLTLLVGNRTSLTPNQITVAAFVLGLGAAASFLVAEPWALVLGAVLYHFSFVLDCVDGKIARLKGSGTFFGAWLDYVLDRLRVLACAIGLVTGQLWSTGDVRYVFLGFVIVFLDMFRYVNALHVWKTRVTVGMALAEQDDPAAHAGDRRSAVAALGAEPGPVPVRERFPLYATLLAFLLRHRVRIHLFSGIEFQMFVFIVGPILAAAFGRGVTFPVVIGSGLLLVLFESMVVYRLRVTTSRAQRKLARATADTADTADTERYMSVPPQRMTTAVGDR